MAKKRSKKSSGGFFVKGSSEAKGAVVGSYAFDIIFEMIAERIRAGEDPEKAAKEVLDLAKTFAESDEVIFDDDPGVSVEEAMDGN
jgi:hypothetical protein